MTKPRTIEVPAGVIGVIHLRALPGDPMHGSETFDDVVDAATRDAEALLEGGIEALIVENFGSAPFAKGTVDDPVAPHVHAFLARAALACRKLGARTGINCLRNDGYGALGVAAATGAAFIRVNVLSGAFVTDQGIIESDAARILRYRAAVAPSVAVLADVLVKHAAPLAPVEIEQAVLDTVERAGADAVIISGSGTGARADLDRVQRAAEVSTVPVLIGSGVTADNLQDYVDHVDGVIVGTALKVGGDVHTPVDAERVRRMVERWQELK